MTINAYSLDVKYLRSRMLSLPLISDQTVKLRNDCPLCGEDMEPLIAVTGQHKHIVLEKNFCPRCQFVDFRRRPSDDWFEEYYRTDWDSGREKPKTFQGTLTYTRNIARIEQLTGNRKDARILDMGAGYGNFLKECESVGLKHLTGLETSEKRHAYCKSIGLAVSNATAETITLDAQLKSRGPYDVVHSHHVLEHVVDVREAINQVWSVLKPGGHAIFYVPDLFNEPLMSVSVGLFHVRNFTALSLRVLFESADFRVLEVREDGDLEIVAQKPDDSRRERPHIPESRDEFLARFSHKIADDLMKNPETDPNNKEVYVSEHGYRSGAVSHSGRFPMLSEPRLLPLMFGAYFFQRTVSRQPDIIAWADGFRRFAYRIYRRLRGVGKIEFLCDVKTSDVGSDDQPGKPLLRVNFPQPVIVALFK